jgi:hypothetical protein
VEPTIELSWPTLGIEAQMHVEADEPVVVAANPAHPNAVAIEPQTHAPAGLRRLLEGEPYSLQALQPDAALRLTVTFNFREMAPRDST